MKSLSIHISLCGSKLSNFLRNLFTNFRSRRYQITLLLTFVLLLYISSMVIFWYLGQSNISLAIGLFPFIAFIILHAIFDFLISILGIILGLITHYLWFSMLFINMLKLFKWPMWLAVPVLVIVQVICLPFLFTPLICLCLGALVAALPLIIEPKNHSHKWIHYLLLLSIPFGIVIIYWGFRFTEASPNALSSTADRTAIGRINAETSIDIDHVWDEWLYAVRIILRKKVAS